MKATWSFWERSPILKNKKKMETLQKTLDELDAKVGVERIYTPLQLSRVLKDFQPLYYRPTIDQIKALPNEG